MSGRKLLDPTTYIKIQHYCLKNNANEGIFDFSSELVNAETQKLHITLCN
jgi:hypothetical protein